MVPGAPLVSGTSVGTVFAIPRFELFDAYLELPPEGQVALVASAILVLGIVVFGLLPGYGNRTLRTARRSPVISFLVGIPGTLFLLGMLYMGAVVSESSIGIFFAIPLVSFGLVLLPTWLLLGATAIGASIGSRLGNGSTAIGIVLGAILLGGAALSLEVLLIVGSLFACLGVGAGTRVLIVGGTSTSPDERTVPPANKI